MTAGLAQRPSPSAFDIAALRLTRLRVFALSFILLAVAVIVSVAQFSSARDLILPAGAVIGGDYVAFDVAASAAAEGRAAEAYDQARFEAMLKEYGPPKERFGLTWQYPPTYFLVIAPLALLPYVAGYALWAGGTAALFFAALRAAGVGALALFVVLAAPATFQAVITGQNGFLTGALLLVAALFPNRRPLLAGAAAALLTVKPQFGVLIPIAYLAAGCHRAFLVAAFGAMALALAATTMLGADIWTAFLGGLSGAGDNLAAARMPLYKMATPFAAARFAGLPFEAAAGVAVFFAAAAAAIVVIAWRRVKDAMLRASTLIALVFLAAPYGFYYELVLLAAPLALLVERALRRGWLPGEQMSVAIVFLLTLLLPQPKATWGLSLGLIVVLAVAAIVLRRVRAETPGLFAPLRFSNAGSQAAAD